MGIGNAPVGWLVGRYLGPVFAEYAVAAATNVVPKPTTITFEQAAAVPMSGLTALQIV
jgi:NADPH:quinone reductase-like Zn-dependent oxidoreductase